MYVFEVLNLVVFFVKFFVKLGLFVVHAMVSMLSTAVVSALLHTINSGKDDCPVIARAATNTEPDRITITTKRKGSSSCGPPIRFHPH